MIRALYRAAAGDLDTNLGPGQYQTALADPRGLLWVDFFREPNETCEKILTGTFGFHPLAVEDAIQESHVPKVDDWGSYLYIVLHALHLDPGAQESLIVRELDIFVGGNYIVTHHEEPIESLDRVWGSCLRDPRQASKGAEHMLYHLLDELVAGHMPVVDAIDETVDRIEDQILDKPKAGILEEVLIYKRALLHLRRIIAPQREVLNRLARDEYEPIPPGSRIYFRDIYDNLVRLYDISENMRDLVSGALEIYLSVLNNRLNEVMKTLTLITTLFMPISFVTGFFGMNFFQPAASLTGWTARVTFAAVCAALALIPFLMYFWLRRRRWV